MTLSIFIYFVSFKFVKAFCLQSDFYKLDLKDKGLHP